MKPIAFVTSSTLYNRKEATWITLFLLAKELSLRGYSPYLIARQRPQLPALEYVEGIPVYRLYEKNDPFAVLKSLRFLAQEKGVFFPLLHGFSSSPSLALELSWAARSLGRRRPKILHTLKSYSKHSWTKLFTPALNLVDIITTPTLVMKRKQVFGGCFRNIRVVRSPIDTEKFRPRDREALKQKHGFSGKKIIFYYGALQAYKGVDALLQALPEILQKHPSARVIFAVRSQETGAREKYLAQAQVLGISHRIEILLDDLPLEEYVSMADVVVLAYPHLRGTEGNPSCLLESLASKTPVVTTALPELQEIVAHEKEVLMAQPGDVSSLTPQIDRALSDTTLVREITERGYTVAQEFSVQKIADEFVQLYEEVLARK